MVERDPNDDKNVIVEIRPGAGGDEAGAVGRRPVPDAHPLRRAARLQGRAAVDRRRRLHLRGQGRRRLLGVQVRGRHPPRPARARDRVPGPDPHLDGDRRGAARGRGRRGRDRPQRPADRRLPQLRARAASRSTRPTRRSASPTSRPGSSSRCRTRSPSCRTASARCACCAPGCTSGRWPSSRPSSAPAALAQVGTGERAEKIRTYNYGEKRVKDHRINLLVHNLDAILMGELDELTDALQDDEKRRRLEEQAVRLTPTPSRSVMLGHVAGVTVRRRGRAPAADRLALPAVTARAWTPSCCSPRVLGVDRGAAGDGPRRAAGRAGAEPRSRRCSRAARRASRSPTSSAAATFAVSRCTSTAAC